MLEDQIRIVAVNRRDGDGDGHQQLLERIEL
jgi:hypothetical protein